MPRNSAPVVGAQGSAYLAPEEQQVGLGLKYQYSFRHFTGANEDKDRDLENSEVKNTLYLFTLDYAYGWTDQTQINISIPYQIAERSQGAGSGFPGQRRVSHANGIGDVTIGAFHWLADVHEHLDENIGVGLGLKIPTGNPATQDSRRVNPTVGGNRTYASTNDQSIQPGDGGWGYVLSLYGFKQYDIFTPYFYGSYLFNPQEKNGVTTGRSKVGEEIMSIADSYLARIGSMVAVPQIEGLSLGLGLRIEGVPVRDIFGDDGGFRRPGYAISVEPQAVYVVGKDVFSLAVPWAWIRNRQRNVADQYSGGHGDAAFADYLILLGWSRRF